MKVSIFLCSLLCIFELDHRISSIDTIAKGEYSGIWGDYGVACTQPWTIVCFCAFNSAVAYETWPGTGGSLGSGMDIGLKQAAACLNLISRHASTANGEMLLVYTTRLGP